MIMVFWFLVVLMVLLAFNFVLRPIIHQSRTATAHSSSALYQERLAELERDKESGTLSSDQYRAVKLELERSFLNEMENAPAQSDKPSPQPGERGNKLTVGIIILFLPLLAFSIYMKLGQPRIIEGLKQLSAMNGSGDGQKHSQSIQIMVEKLAQRLQSEPDNEEGWNMLARSYMALKRYKDAAAALEHLYTLTGDRPDVLVRYADALAMANNGILTGRPEELIQQALQLDPDNLTGLWLAGMAAFEHEAFQQALEHWHKLLPLLANNQQAESEVRQLMARAEERLGVVKEEPLLAAGEQTEAAPPAGKTITVKVSLAPALNERVNREDTVFVFARALSGPPMPIAVVRKQVKDLPLEVVLDDSMAMMPTRKLSSFEQVEVSARISKTGNALPQSGDLTATEVLVEVGNAEPLLLSINQEL